MRYQLRAIEHRVEVVERVQPAIDLGLRHRHAGYDAILLLRAWYPFSVVAGLGEDRFPASPAHRHYLLEMTMRRLQARWFYQWPTYFVNQDDEIRDLAVVGHEAFSSVGEVRVGPKGRRRYTRIEQTGCPVEGASPIVGENKFQRSGQKVAVAAKPKCVAVVELHLKGV